MKLIFCRRIIVALAGAVIYLVLVAPVFAQSASVNRDTWTVPRTSDGRPDLNGVWANNNATPLERPAAWAGKDHLSGEELAALKAAAVQATDPGQDALFGDQLVLAAIAGEKGESYDPGTGNYNQFWIVERDFSNQTSLVVDPSDGRIPSLTKAAKRRQVEKAAYRIEHPADTYTDVPLSERCVTYGVPRIGAGYNSYFQIFQSVDYVVFYMEMNHDARVISLDDRQPIDSSIQQWHGNSIGRWEGDTLVVETANYSPKSNFMGASDQLKLIERFTWTAPKTLQYEVTIDDPTTWSQPWTVSIPLMHSDDALYEYACHEGNYAMEGILAGERAKEKAVSVQAK